MICARSRSTVILAAALSAALVIGAPVAGAATPSAKKLSFSLRLRNSGEEFLGRLINNCQLFEGVGWDLPQTTTKFTYATAIGPQLGTLDLVRHSGAAYVKNGGLQVEQIFGKGSPRALQFADLGIGLDGRRAYLVGRIKRGRPQTAAASRVRLAEIRRPRFEHDLLFDARGKKREPSTFSFFVSGRLTMLPAIVRAFERTRCKGGRFSSRPWKRGYEIGFLDVSIRPDVALGLEGTSTVTFDVSDDRGAPIAVEPQPGATRTGAAALQAPVPGGVPLACLAAADCVPSGAGVPLPPFDLVAGDRRVAVTDVTVTSTRTAPDVVQQTITGTLGGAPVTVTDGSRSLGSGRRFGTALTPEFDQRASEALGVSISGTLQLEFSFTRTGPA